MHASASTRRACSRQAVQDRLVANGGALGESALPGAGLGGDRCRRSIGHANVWARGADQFGSATAPASSAGVGYDINRAAPFIAGVDWRLDNGIVAGIAATYVATSASFKDGSHTNVSSYQGAAYAGWTGGPWYALGSAVVSFNDFSTSRLLTPFGLPGDATSSPSGQSYQGHAEAGYHWVLPAAGVTISVTPYAALDYVNAHVSGFSETGGFGALSVNSADSNSLQTTLGVRLTSRIAMGSYGTLIPEVRLGWNHEFGDASQSLSASLIGVPGSSFSATGIAFGRDAALIGAGLSMELSPDAKVFVDYDGKLGPAPPGALHFGRVEGEVLAAPRPLRPLFAEKVPSSWEADEGDWAFRPPKSFAFRRHAKFVWRCRHSPSSNLPSERVRGSATFSRAKGAGEGAR